MARIDDPDLLDRILREFRIKGKVAPFDLSPTAVPIFDIGKLIEGFETTQIVATQPGGQGVRIGLGNSSTALQISQVPYEDNGIFDSGLTTNPSAGDVIVDTGQLVSGSNLIHGIMCSDAAITGDFAVEWRNAANSATLAIWVVFVGVNNPTVNWGPFILNMATDERVRVVATNAVVGVVNSSLGVRRFSASSAS